MRDGMAITVRRGALGVVVHDWNLCLVEADPVARRMCVTWADTAARSRAGRARRVWRLPVALANACRALRNDQSGSVSQPGEPSSPPSSAIPHPHLLGVTASMSMICRSRNGLSTPQALSSSSKGLKGRNIHRCCCKG